MKTFRLDSFAMVALVVLAGTLTAPAHAASISQVNGLWRLATSGDRQAMGSSRQMRGAGTTGPSFTWVPCTTSAAVSLKTTPRLLTGTGKPLCKTMAGRKTT